MDWSVWKLENLKTTSIWIASTSPPWQEPCVCVMNPPLKNVNEQAGIEYQWMSWINFWVIFVKDQLSPTCNISGRPGQAGAERELLGSQIFPVVHPSSLFRWILGQWESWNAAFISRQEYYICCVWWTQTTLFTHPRRWPTGQGWVRSFSAGRSHWSRLLEAARCSVLIACTGNQALWIIVMKFRDRTNKMLTIF